MPRRPALTTATAALCALTALTACQGSPEAGQPNTTPTTTSSTRATVPTPTPSPTTAEEAAVTAAKARYLSAWAAIDTALNNPVLATDAKLLQAGTGGEWLIRVLSDVEFNKERGWYQNGKTSVKVLSVASVKLKAEQPEVRLLACLDTSKTALYFQKTRKPIPAIPANGDRHKVQAQVVYAVTTGQSKKMWYLINQTELGSC